jgi:general secretion pathway protein D
MQNNFLSQEGGNMEARRIGIAALAVASFLTAPHHALSQPSGARGFGRSTPPAVGVGAEDNEPAQGLRDENGGLISAKTGKKFSEANPEDITNENFPDLIESFDYPNADIADVIKAIGELTGKNFIVDPQVRGKITIIAPSQITVAEAYRAFLSALAINGLTVVPSGAFLKIKTARNAQRDSIETYSGEYFPNSDQMITRIIKLKYISADEVNKQLRILPSKDGEMVPYPPTNSIIISDYGANIERVMKIINQLDVPGFEEQLEVIRIKYAKAKDIEELLSKIINDGEDSNKGVPRFRRRSSKESDSGGSTESFSLVVGDERTNSIIVVGNKQGITKIRKLISKLDFRLKPEDQGGVYVYYVRHGEAEQIANTINGIAENSNKAQEQTTTPKAKGGTEPVQVGPSSAAIFGGDVKVTFDKNTNSLIVTASKQDYEVVKNLLNKIDIARDQVFVKVIIMEMSASSNMTYGVDFYNFDQNSNGVGRIGFRSSDNISSLLDPTGDRGGVLGFGQGDTIQINPGGVAGAQAVTVTSIAGLVSFLKTATNANVLSTPQIMALDNEESVIEVGAQVPVGRNQSTTANGVTQNNIDFRDATIKLELTPYISPDTDAVQMKINQQIAEVSETNVRAAELAESAASTTKRQIKTQIVVNSGDTAVLGGLMQDKVTEQESKIPLLGDIPILGWLFKSTRSETEKQNLIVFITPKIIRSAYDNSKMVTQKINERIDFIQQNMKGRDPHGQFVDQLPRRAKNDETEDQLEIPESLNEEPAVDSF